MLGYKGGIYKEQMKRRTTVDVTGQEDTVVSIKKMTAVCLPVEGVHLYNQKSKDQTIWRAMRSVFWSLDCRKQCLGDLR